MYIGQTTRTLKERWTQHIYDSNRFKYAFPRAIQKYGADYFIPEVLEEVNDITLLNETEEKWINYYDTRNKDKGYNIMTELKNGRQHSLETRKEMSRTRKGKPPWNKGKTLSEEHKRNISKSSPKLGNPNKQSEESKEKISKKMKGNKHLLGHIHSEETKARMREAHARRKCLSHPT